MKRSLLKSLIIGLGVLASFNLYAAVIQIDFGDEGDDPSSPSNPGGNWNIIAGANRNSTTANLIDFNTGAGSGISVTGNNFSNFSFATDPIQGFAGGKDWVDANASLDSIFVESGTATLTFSGPFVGNARVEIVSSADFNTTSQIIVNGAPTTDNFDNTGGVSSNSWNENSDGFTPGNWLIWDDVAAEGQDIVISITDISGIGGGADINAIRLEVAAVPEPGTYVMFATIILGAVYMKLRSRKKEEDEATSEATTA